MYLTESEWNAIDSDIVQFSHIGVDQSSIYNFWEATNQIGTINFGDLFESVIDTSQQVILVNSINVYGQNNATAVNSNQSLQMMADVLPQNATNNQLNWTVTNVTGSANISNNGLLTPTGVGTVTVKASAQDGSNTFGEANISILGQENVLVTEINVQGENNASSVLINQSLQMMAQVLPQNATNNQVSWSVDDGTGTATINNAGLLSANTAGTVFVKATAQDASNVYGVKTITINNEVNITETQYKYDSNFS